MSMMRMLFLGDDKTPINIQRDNLDKFVVHYDDITAFDLANEIENNGVDHIWLYNADAARYSRVELDLDGNGDEKKIIMRSKTGEAPVPASKDLVFSVLCVGAWRPTRPQKAWTSDGRNHRGNNKKQKHQYQPQNDYRDYDEVPIDLSLLPVY